MAVELQELFSNQFLAIKIKKNNLSMEVKSMSLVHSVKRLSFHMRSDEKKGLNAQSPSVCSSCPKSVRS